MRSPISPPPGNIMDGETGCTKTSTVSILEMAGMAVFWFIRLGDCYTSLLLETSLILQVFDFWQGLTAKKVD
jgi:hypothetical protein